MKGMLVAKIFINPNQQGKRMNRKMDTTGKSWIKVLLKSKKILYKNPINNRIEF